MHDPDYRKRFGRNLRDEFPRIPFYTDFNKWASWGAKLLALHTNYERSNQWPLNTVAVMAKGRKRQERLSIDKISQQEEFSLESRAPKCILKANLVDGVIEIDAITRLVGIPPEAWDYRLANRSALEWVLEGYRGSDSKDPTIQTKFNTYRFDDHKNDVIDLLGKVCRVSVETMAIVSAMERSVGR